MPVISRFFGIAIAIYWNDHAPPHFHAKYSGEEVVVEIDSGVILKGTMSKRALSLIEEWRQRSVTELKEDWELAREHRPLMDIAPLE